jgi:D-inositol-3-phosphate glycosyltransferase
MPRIAVLSVHTSPLAQPGVGDGGGLNVLVRKLATALARKGASVDVYTRRTSPHEPCVVSVEPGFEVHAIQAGPLAPVPKEDLPLVLEEFRTGVLERLSSPERAPEAIWSHYWLSGVVGHYLKHELELPFLATFHTLSKVKEQALSSLGGNGSEGREPCWREAAEEEIVQCADGLIVSTFTEAEELSRLYGADKQRVHVIRPAVDHAYYAPGDRLAARRALGLEQTGEILLFVGRIQPLKRPGVALEVFSRLRSSRPRMRLVIIGGPSGPEGLAEMESIKQAIEAIGAREQVLLIPPQPHELLSTWYRASDLCIVPSYSESFGLVALEAAACGIPVIASRSGGLVEVVRHGETGFLVRPQDTSGFVEAANLLLSSPELRTQIGKAAAARAGKFNWSRSGESVLGLFEDLDANLLLECGAS